MSVHETIINTRIEIHNTTVTVCEKWDPGYNQMYKKDTEISHINRKVSQEDLRQLYIVHHTCTRS